MDAAPEAELASFGMSKGPKDPTVGYCSASEGIVILILGRYLLFGYLDP